MEWSASHTQLIYHTNLNLILSHILHSTYYTEYIGGIAVYLAQQQAITMMAATPALIALSSIPEVVSTITSLLP